MITHGNSKRIEVPGEIHNSSGGLSTVFDWIRQWATTSLGRLHVDHSLTRINPALEKTKNWNHHSFESTRVLRKAKNRWPSEFLYERRVRLIIQEETE